MAWPRCGLRLGVPSLPPLGERVRRCSLVGEQNKKRKCERDLGGVVTPQWGLAHQGPPGLVKRQVKGR